MGAVVQLQAGGLTVTERADLADRIQELAITVAGLAGEVKAMREARQTDYDHLIERIEQANHRRRTTDATLEKAIELLHAYPKPSTIEALIVEVDQLQGWRQRMVGMALGIAAGSGLLSGGVVAAIVRASSGGSP